MKIKTKLNVGIGLLLLLIILMAIFSIRQIKSLSDDSENIIKDNKETVKYTQEMLESLNDIEQRPEYALKRFEFFLLKQNQNITEPGEIELTDSVNINFRALKQDLNNEALLRSLQDNLFLIMSLNLRAIEHKNIIAAATAHKSVLFITILSVICFLFALVLFITLPGNISKPIRELIKSIREISDKNYAQKVEFVSHSELGELALAFNVMAQKLDEYNTSNVSKLLTEKKISETLLNNFPFPIIGFDQNLMVTLANEEFCKISELQFDSLIGKHIIDIAQWNDVIKQLVIMVPPKEIQPKDKEISSPVHLLKNGKDIYYEKEIQEISYTSTDYTKKQLLGHVIILKNITRFVDMDIAKTKFIATLSHELKTPLSAIKFGLQLLQNNKTGTLNKEQLELISSCEEDTNNLLRIIADLLNITQIETGNIPLNILPASLPELVNYAVSTNKPFASQKGISIEVQCPENITTAYLDREKTTWVVSNLISNAISYSDENSKIHIRIEETENRQIVSIKDQGKGIEPQYIEKIFDRYFRVPGTKINGTGLGLAISKEFIEAQGGRIIVESEPGAGSTFTIILAKKNEYSR